LKGSGGGGEKKLEERRKKKEEDSAFSRSLKHFSLKTLREELKKGKGKGGHEKNII